MPDESLIERLRRILRANKRLLIALSIPMVLGLAIVLFASLLWFRLASDLPRARQLPDFPWPPRSSARSNIPTQYVIKPEGQTLLRDVGFRLEDAFRRAGYVQTGYYGVPGGFALTSRLEQFKPNGLPVDEPNRWSSEIPIPQLFSTEYLTLLIRGKVGRYRVIVFIVTNDFFSQENGKSVESSQAESLAIRGANALPDEVGLIPFRDNYTCTALIYEFEKKSSDQRAEFKDNATLSAERHLQQILPQLQR